MRSMTPRQRAATALALTLAFAACGPRGGRTAGDSAAAAAAAPAISADSTRTLADRSRIYGDTGATVWLIEVSDFQCPYCRIWHEQTYPVVRRDYVERGRVRMAYLNFPIPTHAHAFDAAEAALCAGVQDRFWEYHDALFRSQERWAGLASADSAFAGLARDVGIDVARWRACRASGWLRPLVMQDAQRVNQTGARSTPTFFIGDTAIVGAQPVDVFRRVIDEQLARAARGGARGR